MRRRDLFKRLAGSVAAMVGWRLGVKASPAVRIRTRAVVLSGNAEVVLALGWDRALTDEEIDRVCVAYAPGYSVAWESVA